MCSFGQDALDSLYLSTVHKKKRRVLVHFTIVCVTACLHSLLLFVHVTTLTVAVNSSDQVLIYLFIYLFSEDLGLLPLLVGQVGPKVVQWQL